MPSNSLDNFEKKKFNELEKFLNHWDWDQVFKTWKSRLSDFSISVDELFSEVQVFDPQHPENQKPVLSWWPKEESKDLHLLLQEHLDQYPGTQGPIHSYSPFHIRKGELKTLEYLWHVKGDKKGVCAVLLKASLFSRMYSNRGSYPHSHWPPFYCVNLINKFADEELTKHFEGEFYGWHRSSTEVIPIPENDYEYRIDSMKGMIRHLAEEHAVLFLSIRPTHILFDSKDDPFIRNALSEIYKKDAIRHQQWKESFKKAEKEKLEKENILKEKHPRWGEFINITPKELETLVWSKPTKIIADVFGVSDVAVGKRCKKYGISKPPRGFWAKVNSEKIPHPNGTSQYTKNNSK